MAARYVRAGTASVPLFSSAYASVGTGSSYAFPSDRTALRYNGVLPSCHFRRPMLRVGGRNDARQMPKIAPSGGRHLQVSPSHEWRACNNGRLNRHQRLVERDFSQRARASFGPGDRRHRDECDADVGHCHHHADHRSRHRRGELLHLGGDALYDRRDCRRRLDRHGVVAPWCSTRPAFLSPLML
jgi:hypothetical protein